MRALDRHRRRGRGADGGIVYDRVIACTGFRMDDSIFTAECRPQLTIRDRFPALTHEWESVNVAGLYEILSPRDCNAAYTNLLHNKTQKLVTVFDWRKLY